MTCDSNCNCAPDRPASEEADARTSTLRPRGALTTDRAQALAELLDTADHHGAQRIIVDLSAADLLGAAAMGVLVARRERLALDRPTHRVAEQLRLVGLDRLLPFA